MKKVKIGISRRDLNAAVRPEAGSVDPALVARRLFGLASQVSARESALHLADTPHPLTSELRPAPLPRASSVQGVPPELGSLPATRVRAASNSNPAPETLPDKSEPHALFVAKGRSQQGFVSLTAWENLRTFRQICKALVLLYLCVWVGQNPLAFGEVVVKVSQRLVQAAHCGTMFNPVPEDWRKCE